MSEKPIVQTGPENSTVDLNMQVTTADQKANLDAKFDEFFGEKLADAPSAPKKDAEPVKAEEKVEPKIESRKVKAPAKKAPDLDDTPAKVEPPKEVQSSEAKIPVVPVDEDAELDSLPAPTHPKAKADWDKVRTYGKGKSAVVSAYEHTFGDLSKEYGVPLPKTADEAKELLPKLRAKIDEERKRPAPKELLDELEQHKEITRKIGLKTNQQFTKEYVDPVLTSYVDVIDDTSSALIEGGVPKDQAETWATNMKTNFSPEKLGFQTLPTTFWQEKVLNSINDQFRKNTIFGKIQDHLNRAKMLRDKTTELTGSPDKFKAYNDDQVKNYNTWFYNEQFDEVSKIARAIEDIHEWGVAKELTGVTDQAKRKEIEDWNEAHKDAYDKTLKTFKKWVDRLAGQPDEDEPSVTMPRWQGRAAMEIMKALRATEKMDALVKENASLKAKLEKHETEANKRARVQSIPSRPQSSGTVKAKPDKTTKIGQNVRDAFDDYNWG
jgi:hypothetical protein